MCVYIYICVCVCVCVCVCDSYPVGWGCRKHRMLLCREVRPPPNEWLRQSDDEVPVMLGLWGMRSIPSLPSLPGPLWPMG